jgi:hypothetical protein
VVVRPLLAVSFLLLTALAGCSDGDGDAGEPTPTGDDGGEPTDACPQVDEGSVVTPGWVEHGGNWGTAPTMEGHVAPVCGEATAALSHLVNHAMSYDAVLANVSFNMLQDEVGGGSGAGLVINWKGVDDYVIVRYSPREQGWHLFTMTGGERTKQDDASVTPPTTNPDYHQWVQLSVRHEDGHVTAFDGTTKVIDYMLPADASHSGYVGFFLRDEGMAALFDDFVATPL